MERPASEEDRGPEEVTLSSHLKPLSEGTALKVRLSRFLWAPFCSSNQSGDDSQIERISLPLTRRTPIRIMYLEPDFTRRWFSCGFFSWEDLVVSARVQLGA